MLVPRRVDYYSFYNFKYKFIFCNSKNGEGQLTKPLEALLRLT